jgi:glycosyltransferase involved in cell wall biosynthesis
VIIDAIIPARNEETTVATSVAAARACACVREVIVVDDGSLDATADRAREAGAKVVERPGSTGSKAHAMADGVARSDAEAFLFVDADLLGITAAHLDAICDPVVAGWATMSVGLFDYGRFWNPYVRRWPPLSGERLVPRWVWEAVPPHRRDGYTIEMRINHVIARHRCRTAVRTMTGVQHRNKRAKHGLVDGVWRTAAMYRDLVRVVWPFGEVSPRSYVYYLRALTIEG